jgi:hypothetical protein
MILVTEEQGLVGAQPASFNRITKHRQRVRAIFIEIESIEKQKNPIFNLYKKKKSCLTLEGIEADIVDVPSGTRFNGIGYVYHAAI